jgi:2-(1,2-epoxy-1,2-dihydrophenyl)acetyl-CoA isomerase
VRVVILTGAGSDFCAGADVREIGGGGIPGSIGRLNQLHRMARAINGIDKPVIAAVRGVCIGMAWGLVLGCDITIVAEDARFQCAFRHIGIAPDNAVAFLLTRYLPIQRAKEIVYSGRFVSGTEAHQLGLALHCLPSGDVLAKARALAADFAEAPTIALGFAKRMFEAAPGQSYDQALAYEAVLQPLAVQTEDFREGALSFKEKRKAKFKGA